ncbi:hypothetical protein GZH47_23660 [Paenibacillus rhizovicinus]|uniref:Ketopantoate reductase C-terminal domain-containing protein n=1 Tax=Paenibacillus rhizovicinus TaxID=2704463 RepID=A0A6C0P4W5_9BACL|nr:ketopantoate reductase C-terminal domain-containing protein [Paenibacillus rhizovicinus]QHW33497.1 hypothetical protein GZH47_23660 [Paenibacillus rhizovicinus]
MLVRPAVLARAGKGKSSMLQDAEGHRKTEIEVIIGAVVKAASASGVDVPLNRAMVALIGGLERGWRVSVDADPSSLRSHRMISI